MRVIISFDDARSRCNNVRRQVWELNRLKLEATFVKADAIDFRSVASGLATEGGPADAFFQLHFFEEEVGHEAAQT
jgi:hypothetical protein